MDIDKFINLFDFEKFASEMLSEAALSYLNTGAGDGSVVVANQEFWKSIEIYPRVLASRENIDTSVVVLKNKLPHPIILAPVASHAAFNPNGEAETISGALKSLSTLIFSTHSSLSLNSLEFPNELDWWFQLYLHRNRQVSRNLANVAITKGASALVVTVDTPIAGYRDLDRRVFPEQGPRLTPGQPDSSYPNLVGLERFEDGKPRHRKVVDPVLDPNLSWSEVNLLIKEFDVPVILKGIVHPDDAIRAFESGAAGIVVSNHGGRNLDGAVVAAKTLSRIRKAVGPNALIIVDGGIRRGSDVFKALALGANSVLIGRPYIWGLSAFGALGVERVVEILRTELETTMLLSGTQSISSIGSQYLFD